MKQSMYCKNGNKGNGALFACLYGFNIAERFESVSGELRELGFFNSHGFGR